MTKDKLKAIAAEIVTAKKAEIAKAKKPPEKAEAKPAPAKPAKAEAPKETEAKKPAAAPTKTPAEVAADWERLVAEQAAEVVALVKGAPKCARPVRLVTGVAVPPAALADYRAMIARHGKARAAMRDNSATTEGVYFAALRALNGDEIAALCELGMMHTAGNAGSVAVPALRSRKAAEVWLRALQAAKPGAVSVVVSVRAIAPAAAAKPAAKPEAKPAADKGKSAAKPSAKPAATAKPKTASKGGIVNLAP